MMIKQKIQCRKMT